MRITDLLEEMRRADAREKLSASHQEFLELVAGAEKFQFGDLHLEPQGGADAGKPVYQLPALTPDELQFWGEGLIPFPAKTCWYEFTINGIVSGVLVEDRGGGLFRAQRIDFVRDFPPLVGYWVYLTGIKSGHVMVSLLAPNPVMQERMECLSDERKKLLFYSVRSLVMYMTLMVSSRTTLVSTSTLDARLNATRLKRGKLPLPPHRVVTILPQALLREFHRSQGLPGTPKRLHWRRSHVRVIHRGTDLERRVLIPRFLVGRRELGEVSHEYTVRGTFTH